MADANEPEATSDFESPSGGPNSIGSLTFEEAFNLLGDVAGSLEDGGLTLAEATSRYEQGMNLVRRCNKLLDEAELKITELKNAHVPENLETETETEFFDDLMLNPPEMNFDLDESE